MQYPHYWLINWLIDLLVYFRKKVKIFQYVFVTDVTYDRTGVQLFCLRLCSSSHVARHTSHVTRAMNCSTDGTAY